MVGAIFLLSTGCGSASAGKAISAATTPITASPSPPSLSTGTGIGTAAAEAQAQLALARAQTAQAVQAVRSARQADSWLRQLATPLIGLAGVALAAVVALVGVVAPLERQRFNDREQRREAAEADIVQRGRDEEQRESASAADLAQREKDRIQRFDSGFAAAVTALGSTSPPTRAGGAAALQTFLRPDLDSVRDQVYAVIRANLDTDVHQPEFVQRLLATALTKALASLYPPAAQPPPRVHSTGRQPGPDLDRLWLVGGDFRSVDLSSADVAFSVLRNARLDGVSLRRAWGWKVDLGGASLRGANLEEARFRRAVAPGAIFDGARLVSARFEKADLTGARFRNASLQAAHFQEAHLEAADFRNAKLADTSFKGAVLDDDALKTLLLSATWHFLASANANPHDVQRARTQVASQLDPAAAQRLLTLAQG